MVARAEATLDGLLEDAETAEMRHNSATAFRFAARCIVQHGVRQQLLQFGVLALSTLRRFVASETSSPPYLAFQL